MSKYLRVKLFGLVSVFSFLLPAQEIEVKGGFVQDSLKIGLNVEYWMTAKYPAEIDLFLPDSNYNFSPYEFGGREYFETRTDSTHAVDSVVYSLQSFEIDQVQYLTLPATLILNKDSSRIFTSKDSVFLVELVSVATDTTSLITNTNYQKVNREFNSPFLMIVVGFLVFVGLVVLLVFGKKIRRLFLLKRMAKSHQKFLTQFSGQIELLKNNGKPDLAESTLGIWKNYQEKIEKQPFTKLTSKEMIAYDFAKELRNPLREIDRCVYSKLASATVYKDFQHLEGFSENRYNHHVDKIRHGK